MTASQLYNRTSNGFPDRKTSVEVAGITVFLSAFLDEKYRPGIEIDNDFRNNPQIQFYSDKTYGSIATARKDIIKMFRNMCDEFRRFDKEEKRLKKEGK